MFSLQAQEGPLGCRHLCPQRDFIIAVIVYISIVFLLITPLSRSCSWIFRSQSNYIVPIDMRRF